MADRGDRSKKDGGGAEALARYKMYEYRAVGCRRFIIILRNCTCVRALLGYAHVKSKMNSSLVLTTDAKRDHAHEPTGEPETLWGKVNPKTFGDRAHDRKKVELEEKMTKSKAKRDEKSKRTGDDMDELVRKK
eukprot:5952758-Pyramimonas_sp.AAC.1